MKTPDSRDSNDNADLGAFFDAARRQEPEPSNALLTRIAEDAIALQRQRAGEGAITARRGLWSWLSARRDARIELAGLVAAACAGLWLGFSQPAELGDLMLGPSESDAYLVDPVSAYDLALLEG